MASNFVEGIKLKNEQFKFAERKCHRRKMTCWPVYSVAKLVFIQVHTEDPLKNIRGRRMDQGVVGAGLKHRDTKNVAAKWIQKKPWVCLPVFTPPGLVMTAGKGGAEWFISSQVNQLSTSKRFIARKFE